MSLLADFADVRPCPAALAPAKCQLGGENYIPFMSRRTATALLVLTASVLVAIAVTVQEVFTAAPGEEKPWQNGLVDNLVYFGVWGALLGVGLANTSARLHELYGARGGLKLEDAREGGLSARLRIPQ